MTTCKRRPLLALSGSLKVSISTFQVGKMIDIPLILHKRCPIYLNVYTFNRGGRRGHGCWEGLFYCSLTVCMYVCRYKYMSVYFWIAFISLPPPFSLSLYIYIYIHRSVHKFFTVYIYPPLSTNIYLSTYLSLPIHWYLSVYLSIYLSLFISINLSIYLLPFISLYISPFISICLPASLILSLSLSLSHTHTHIHTLSLSCFSHFFQSLSLSLYIYIYIYTQIYLSIISTHIYLCQFLSVRSYLYHYGNQSVIIYVCTYLSIYLS